MTGIGDHTGAFHRVTAAPSPTSGSEPHGVARADGIHVDVEDASAWPLAEAAVRALADTIREHHAGRVTPAELDALAPALARTLGCGVRVGEGPAVATAYPTPGGTVTNGTVAVAGDGRPWVSVTVRARTCELAVEDAIRAAALGSAGSAYLTRRRVSGALVDEFDRVLRIGPRIDPLRVSDEWSGPGASAYESARRHDPGEPGRLSA